MWTPPVDYTADEVKALRAWFEQYVMWEGRYPEVGEQLVRVLAILRGVDDAGMGTEFISREVGKR